MLFDAFKNRKSPKIEFIKTNPTWRVAWGTVDANYEHIAWRDEKISVIIPRTTSEFPTDKLAISSGGRFVVGDVWLTNRVQLLQKLGIEPDSFQGTSLQLVANLWERWGNESLSQLVGMFALVVWDREKQVLKLVRDRIGVRTLYYTTTGSVRWIAPQLRTLLIFTDRYCDRGLVIVLILRLESGLKLQTLHPVPVMKCIAKMRHAFR
jgi:asparagine synthase (glutamine-hydrolysing)